MDETGIFDACDLMGLRSGLPHGGKRGLQVSVSCPLATQNHEDPEDYNTSCSISVRDDEPSLARCFSFNCGFQGSFYKLISRASEMRGNPPALVAYLTKIEPLERMGARANVARSKKRWEAEFARDRRIVLRDHDRDVLPEGRLERFANGIPRYALRRGITIESAKKWGLRHDEHGRRLVFPIRRHDGRLVGMTGRDISNLYKTDPRRTKYHNYAGLDKTRYLFGEWLLEHEKPVVIVEGQIDAILTRQHLGIPTVAPLGEGFSKEHVRTICAHEPKVVYIFPDNDGAGIVFAEKVQYALHGRVPLKIMLPPEEMDPGELAAAQAQRALENAQNILKRIDWNRLVG